MKFENYEGISYTVVNFHDGTRCIFYYTAIDASKEGALYGISEKWAKPWNAAKRVAELEAQGYKVRSYKSRSYGRYPSYAPYCEDREK